MVGHYGLPAITGDRSLPTSASELVMRDLLRGELGFEGVIITDALDMGGFAGVATEDPLHAGADLLLYGPAQKAMLPDYPVAVGGRVADLFEWLAPFGTPSLDLVGSDAHRALAAELAARAVTLVRDEDGILPLRPASEHRILTIMPRPTDLTPADTSSMVEPGLGDAIRSHHPATSEIIVSREPGRGEVVGAVESARAHDIVVVGTIEADAGQGRLVEEILATGVPTVTVAMRTPYDLSRYPSSRTHLCSYGILPPSMRALSDAIFGARIDGRLPASIPGLYPVGHGLSRSDVGQRAQR
jgi:beta-N-acetylhexosaminidase